MPATAQRVIVTLALAGLTVAATGIGFAQNPPAPAPGGGQRVPAAERRPDLQGRVTAISPDGRTLTVNALPRPAADGQPPARDARPEPAQVIVTDRTQVLFFGVGENEAKLAPGLMAVVWLEEGSKDQAARVRLMRREGEERPDVQGRVVAVSPDGRTVTVEQRDGERVTGRTELRLAPYTQALYYGVEREGARPTAGYEVVAWFEKGSKDTAVRARFMKVDPAAAAAAPPQAPR
jgi:hypothetical protein